PPYDAELFGHWWFEGPLWLEHVAREMVRGGVTPATLGEALAGVPPRATLALPEGSWGEGGDHRVWLNRDTEWTWDRVYSAEAEWAAHLAATRAEKGDLARALTQATRELLLLQASDWQFLITTGTARDYAERRVAEHYAECERLQPLTRERSKSAVPFGGRFRLVDFVLSNFMNSELPSIYVLVQYKSQSLIEHLRVAWRTSGQLPDFFVTVVPPQMRFGSGWY